MLDPHRIVARLHLDGTWAAGGDDVAEDEAIAELARREGIVVPRDALQSAVDDYRARLGLHDESETLRWLEAAGLDRKQLIGYCRIRLQHELLLAAIPAVAVRAWFDHHRNDYDAALLSVLSFDSENDAWLARTAAEAAPDEFDDLAWLRPQAEPALPSGGALGWRLRRDLPAAVASAVFADDARGIAGPLLFGARFRLYRVWRRRGAALTEAIEAECRADCLAARLREGGSA